MRFVDRRAFRVAVYAGFVVAMLVLGAIYLSLDRQADPTTWMMVGGDEVRAGLPAAVRVSARAADAREARAAQILGVTLGGRLLKPRVTGDDPAIVHFDVPDGLGARERLVVEVADGERRERLEADLVVRHGDGGVGLPEPPPEQLPPTERPLRVDVLPEAGVLASGMENDVFVRVRGPEGVPVARAHVRVAHTSLVGGSIDLITDGGGVAVFRLKVGQPSVRLKVAVTAGERSVDQEELLHAYGRQLLLRPDPPVFRPGESVTVDLATWDRDPSVICDLLDQKVLVWSERVRVTGHGERLTLAPLPEGLYRLQCYDHPLDPGETFATTPLVVSADAPLEALVAAARRTGRVHEASVTLAPEARSAPPGPASTGFWLAVLREAPQAPKVLAATRERALLARAEARSGQKGRVLGLMAAVFLLMLLFLGEGVVRNVRETQARMRAFAFEEGEEPGEHAGGTAGTSLADLSRTRGLVVVVFAVAVLVLNTVAILWLLAIVD